MKAKPGWFEKVCRGLEETKAEESDERKAVDEEALSELMEWIDNPDAAGYMLAAIKAGEIEHISINY